MFSLYLKSIELQGFKSFPEKTRITFDKPITGVIGPNGSGKSNIADAILWVMGEQSTRTLRGGKMEDVIFGGTQRRTQVGFAEVSLILDNSEGRLGLEQTEIMLTRRYYRSGESEYYINRNLVRLKDVNELLMDTGLGREGYSIIGQGRIADILSSKSKDRRDIFEEAAGISRYRHRKEESERKLQQTEENLVRIGDKISELELQLDPLREQAETARKFLMLRDELRGLEISVWLRELESLRIKAEKAEADYAVAKIARDTTESEVDSGFEETEKISDSMRRCDVEADAVRDMIAGEETRKNELDSAVAVLKSQMEGNITQIDQLNVDLQDQSERHDGVGAQISEREDRLREIETEIGLLDAQKSTLDSELLNITNRAEESSAELGSLMRSDNEIKDELSDKKARFSALASQAQELYDAETSVKQEIAAAAESKSALMTEHENCIAELKKAKEETVTQNNIISGLTLKAQNKIEKAAKTGSKLEQINFDLKTLISRRNLLADLEKDYQGYSNAVKMIMQERSRGTLKNIHGTVAGLIKTGDRYTVAIETALGGAMQNIIVDTEEDGKAAINLLKHRDGGRATFLPVSTINGSDLNKKDISADSGFEGIAIDLIEYDKKYSGIYANLLGRVIIADNLNSAVRIAGVNKYRYKVVTLDGQVISAGGAMTGGSSAGNSGILSRANELTQLAERIKALTAEAEKSEKENTECVREKNAAEYELDVARSELRPIEDRLIRLERDEAHHRLLVQASGENTAALEFELELLNKRIHLNTQETKELKDRLSKLEAEALSLQERISEAIRGQETLSFERNRVYESLSELRARRASFDAEYEALTKSVRELSEMRKEMSGDRNRQIEAISGLKTRNNEILAEISENEKASAAISNLIEEYKQRITDIGSRKFELEAKQTGLIKDMQSKNQKMLDLERECSRIEQKKITAQMEEKQIVDKLWDNYELTRSAALGAGQPIDSLSEAQKRISSLKRRISELGTPNIGAIDEYDRVNTRYTFLTSQRDDVENAKKEINSIISDIVAQMRENFLREFNLISEKFEKTFIELFGGGHASLLLEEPDDVLNSGIEIKVQPPGKSLKTLTLLSGGEKAFVAIAIYFAILAVRPPPFVVMDEIDAALDDSNVLRFASYMRKISNNTQMIVISHKRATMEEADMLYGVTMQELGVSNIIRVDLEEAEKHMQSKKEDN